MFALVDCNNFYASCERVFNPYWNNRPIVVLSNNDGCVIARSNEAKQIGIKMGVPAYQIKTEIEQLLLPFPAYQMNAYLIDNDFLKKPSNDPTIIDKAL